jgi:hypothetical protein
MPRASSGALVDSVNVATVWFSFCRAEALRDTAGERLAAVWTQRDHAFPTDFPRDTRMSELEQQKAEIEARLAEAPADIPDVHPNIAEHYRAKVIRLAETLAEPESNGEAREDIRSIIGEVVITPGEKRGENHATLRGELMAILDFAAGRRISPKPEVITNALAGPRNHFCYNSPPSGLASGTGLSFWNWRRRAVALLQATVRATISVAMTRPALFAR